MPRRYDRNDLLHRLTRLLLVTPEGHLLAPPISRHLLEQTVAEIGTLRQRVAELEGSQAEPGTATDQPGQRSPEES